MQPVIRPATLSVARSASRREFLGATGQAAAVAGAATLSGTLFSGRAIPHVHAAGTDEIRVALIGSGNRGSGAGNDLLTAAEQLQMKGRVKIVAMADAFEDRVTGAVEFIDAGWYRI